MTGGKSRLTVSQEAELCAWLDGRFCRSTVEIRSCIASEFGLEYSHSGCIKLLARLGFEYRKPKPVPKVSSAENQASFIALYERLMTEPGADEAVYFADAVHPEYQTKPAFGRIKSCRADPITVDGVSAAQLLAKIEARNPDKRLIHVIRDNAAYRKGPDVRAFLARPHCRIHLVHLPPYCPQLNLIERLWAVMHQHVTHNRHYPTQKQFANAILRFFRETIPNEWETFQSQVSDNFRVVTYEKFRVLQ